MKVVYFVATPQNFGGSQRAITTLAANLAPGIEAEGLFTGEGRAVDAFRARGIPVHVLPPPRALGLYEKQLLRKSRAGQALVFARDLLPYTLTLRRFLRRSGADLVHCETSRGVLLIGLAARLARIPVLWHLQGENILGLHPHLNRVAGWMSTRLVSCAEGVGTSLPPSVPAEFIRYGIEPGARGPSDEVRRLCDTMLRERGMEPEGCFRFITTASLVPFKGLQHLADGYGALLRERPELKDRTAWFILGDPRTPETREFRGWLAERIRANGVERNAFFVGWQDDPMAWMEATDLLLVPTVLREPFQYPGERPIELFCTEGMPIAILEAMHVGRPVIATRVAGVPEAVVDGRTGLLVAPGSAEELGRALAKLIDDPELRRGMGEAARARATLFTADRMAAEFCDLYRRILHSAPAPAAPALA